MECYNQVCLVLLLFFSAVFKDRHTAEQMFYQSSIPETLQFPSITEKKEKAKQTSSHMKERLNLLWALCSAEWNFIITVLYLHYLSYKNKKAFSRFSVNESLFHPRLINGISPLSYLLLYFPNRMDKSLCPTLWRMMARGVTAPTLMIWSLLFQWTVAKEHSNLAG